MSKGKPKAWTKEHFIAWLETKPPAKTYNYWDTDNCLIAQYTKSILKSTRKYQTFHSAGSDRISHEFRADVSADGEETFGAALERAKKFKGAFSNEQ